MTGLTEFLLTQCRKIHLADYKTQAHIGVVDWEKTRSQEMLFTIDVWVKGHAVLDDDIASVYDYRAVPKAVETVLASGHIQLQETLAEHIATVLLGDTRVLAVRVQTQKTEAVKQAAGIGIEIFRKKAL